MSKLKTTKRIELEIEVRKTAINIADNYGIEGVEFFCQQFPEIANVYSESLKKEYDEDINRSLFPKEE